MNPMQFNNTMGMGTPNLPNQMNPQQITSQPNISSECTLYVGNLHPMMGDTRLFEKFKPFGEVVSCRIMRDLYNGQSRGFAFVSFTNVEIAQKAKDSLNFTDLDGYEMRICFKRSPGDFKPEGNVFFNNLDKKVSAKDLDAVSKEFGNIMSCTIRNDDAGVSLGYGYVQFEKEEAAVKCIEALNDKEMWGTKVSVTKFVSSKNRTLEKKNIYIKNFPEKWTKEQVEKCIKEKFVSIGPVLSEGIYEKKINEDNKFFAFLAYETPEDAEKAIKENNEIILEEGAEKLYVSLAMPKKMRKE